MKFYDALQLDPAIPKRKIAACGTRQEKLYYWTAIAVRSALIVAFAIVFISLLASVFGSDNTPLAVALFCSMLGIRFVNFEYCIGDSLLTLAAALAILVLVPCAAAVVPPVFLIPLHFASFFALLYMTTQRPEMGNGGLYSFAYIYLTGNPVTGEALMRRGLLALVGYLLLLPLMSDAVFGVIFAAVAGIMVFISFDELLPAAREYGEHHLSIYGLISGMAVMAVSLLLFL